MRGVHVHATVRRIALLTGAGLATAAILTGCTSSATNDAAADNQATVVATTTIWGNVADQIMECAGAGTVTTLIPVGADPHDYSASSRDVATMVDADLVVTNGLGLEEGLASSLASAQSDGATVFAVAPLLNPIPFDGEYSEEEAGHSSAPGAPSESGDTHSEDPHVWLDMTRVATGADLIGQELARQTGNNTYATCGTQVAEDITATNGEVTAILDTVPAAERVLVTDHDAFGYFSQAYGYRVAGVVIPGGSTLAQPSSAELSALASTMKTEGVSTIFANTANPTALTEALASEVGNVTVVPLYVGSIGAPDSDAGTYQTMMLANARLIAAGLSG